MSFPQPENNAVVQFAGRNYPRYALQHGIHCVPVDELLTYRPTAVIVGIDIFTGQGHSDEDEDEDEGEDVDPGIEAFIRRRWNLNVRFREDTSSDPLRPETFDLINSRLLSDGIDADRWQSYVRELYALLKPNGWLQMVEIQALFQSDSGRDAPFLSRWWEWYSGKMIQMRKNPRIASQLGTLMTNAGFTDVHYHVSRLPLGSWDPANAQLGMQMRDVVDQMLVDVSLYPFLGLGRMPRAQYDNLIAGARAELRRPELRLYVNVYVPTPFL
ncbi:hypothetical protein CERZMDRAFT_108274 [Cercospora zeae-maydis SCOH1-5]|uniref:Uncharacterized protein n=1 Tax=Cercospora zeae-maydis SCOH1-5 TaxID=717836 RepID=A0A6A6FVX8_9PEZI|nr:hypothetical protein CERZMDRAFT_108274 [Cercospora zeae-maydis SCOH1-5]